MKTIDDYFRDWYAGAIGYGYGHGEQYIVPALRRFMELCGPPNNVPENYGYAYRELERELTPTVTWLLVSILCDEDVVEYGASPRFGWLTELGVKIRSFMLSRTVDSIVERVGRCDRNYIECGPDYCNCNTGEKGYIAGKLCENPFWDRT